MPKRTKEILNGTDEGSMADDEESCRQAQANGQPELSGALESGVPSQDSVLSMMCAGGEVHLESVTEESELDSDREEGSEPHREEGSEPDTEEGSEPRFNSSSTCALHHVASTRPRLSQRYPVRAMCCQSQWHRQASSVLFLDLSVVFHAPGFMFKQRSTS